MNLDKEQMKLAEGRFTPEGDFLPLPVPIPDGEIPVERLLREAGVPMHRLPDQGKQLATQTLLLYKRARKNNPQATIYRACQIIAELLENRWPARPAKATRKIARKQAVVRRAKKVQAHGPAHAA